MRQHACRHTKKKVICIKKNQKIWLIIYCTMVNVVFMWIGAARRKFFRRLTHLLSFVLSDLNSLWLFWFLLICYVHWFAAIFLAIVFFWFLHISYWSFRRSKIMTIMSWKNTKNIWNIISNNSIYFEQKLIASKLYS